MSLFLIQFNCQEGIFIYFFAIFITCKKIKTNLLRVINSSNIGLLKIKERCKSKLTKARLIRRRNRVRNGTKECL